MKVVSCQEHNTIFPARARARTARSRDERTNHEATAFHRVIKLRNKVAY